MKVIAYNVLQGRLIIEIKHLFSKKKYVLSSIEKYRHLHGGVWREEKTFKRVDPVSKLQDVLDNYHRRLLFYGTIESQKVVIGDLYR